MQSGGAIGRFLSQLQGSEFDAELRLQFTKAEIFIRLTWYDPCNIARPRLLYKIFLITVFC